MNRRIFLQTSAGAVLGTTLLQAAELPADHRAAMQRRKRRIVVQYDAVDPMWSYWKLHRNAEANFERYRAAIFSQMDTPGNQIHGI